MAKMSRKEQYRAYVEQWRRTGPELERIHVEELRRYHYDPADADMVLEMGDNYDGPPRVTSGLAEMQRLFMKAARKQWRSPYTMRETPGGYSVCRESGAGVPPASSNIAAGTAAPHLYPVGCRPAVAEGRLAMATTFPDTVRHITAITVTTRNRLVAQMATAVVVAHAAPRQQNGSSLPRNSRRRQAPPHVRPSRQRRYSGHRREAHRGNESCESKFFVKL
jgi:hypothetical protein